MIILRLSEIITPVDQIKESKAQRKQNPGQNVNLLGSKPPGPQPEADLVAQPGWGGRGEEAHQLDNLLSSLYSPQ